MDHNRLQKLSALVLREAKTLLSTGDPSALSLTDPIVDSGAPSAQTFADNRAGDSDYQLWIRLLRLHDSAQSFVDRRPGASADLQERIGEFERYLLAGASQSSGNANQSGYASPDC
jgi:hypothetical protein